MDRACSTNGRQQTAKTSCTLGYKRCKEKAWETKKELDRTIQQDLKSIGMIWEIAQHLAVSRQGWRQRVARCVFDTG